MEAKMSDKEYVSAMGLVCPFCLSKNVTAEDWNGETATQDVSCEDCGKSWWETYELTGFGFCNE